jgi:GNAT superfamily N-acetyltransferase
MDDNRWFHLAEENLMGHLRAMGRCPGSVTRSRPGLEMFAFGGGDIPEFNLAYFRGIGAESLDAALSDCQSFYAGLGRKFLVNAPGLEGSFQQRGWKEVDAFKTMYIDLYAAPDPPAPIPGIEVCRVFGEDGMDDVTRVLCPAWGISPRFQDDVFRMMRGLDISAKGDFGAYVLYLDGLPASSLLIFRQNEIAGVQLVSTLPSQRGKGLAQKLMLHALRSARLEGATHSVLEATRMGAPTYERIGFKASGWSRYLILPEQPREK